MSDELFDRSVSYFRDLHARILDALEDLDGEGRFLRDDWSRGEPKPVGGDPDGAHLGGGGLTCVMEDGAVFEKAGVNFSHVVGLFSKAHAATMPGDGRAFEASGVSLVLHPRNPYVPTVHMNVRRLSRGSGGWFGGGADLTPYYLDPDDAVHFHRVMKAACDAHPGVGDHPRFKKWCDDYFYLPHRREARGVGGIFFDHLMDAPEATFDFVRAVGDAFLPAYLSIARRHMDRPYGERERRWQLVRRGRYVEFNLVYDRGTHFGLKTGGRAESILMSLPSAVSWRYDVRPEPGSPEAALLEHLVPRDWASG